MKLTSIAVGFPVFNRRTMRPKGKFGLRSGNSFHFGGKLSATRTLRHSRDQHVIVKTIVDESLTDVDLRQFTHREAEQLTVRNTDAGRRRLMALASRLVPDGDLPFDDCWRTPGERRLNVGGCVSLTLNKRRRWLLPAVIDDAINQLRQEDLELSDIETVDGGTQPPIRITHSTRLILPRDAFLGRFHRALAADCVSYGDSAPTTRRRAVPRRHKTSFYTDLRRAAGGDPTPRKHASTWRRFPQTHTRGVQRLNTVKHQRSLNKR